MKPPQSRPPVIQFNAALLTVGLVTFHPYHHNTILQPYLLHSTKIWAAFPPYFWVSRLSIFSHIRNRPRIGSNCCLHDSFSTFIFLPVKFWLSAAISQKFCEGFASTFAFSHFVMARNGLFLTHNHFHVILGYHIIRFYTFFDL